MVSRNLSYALRLRGETDPSLPRVFGSVSREIDETNRRIADTRSEQTRLNRELRQVDKGTEEYQRLEREVEGARGEMSRLTGELDRQQSSWGDLNRRADRFRNITLAGTAALGVAVGALILQVDQLGETSAELLSISNATGLAIEDVQRLQRVVGLVGQDLDIGDFNELSIRLGEIRQEGGDIGASRALSALGLDARTVATRDLPLIIHRLQEVDDVQRRAFLADEILGGTLAERLIPALDIPQEQLDRLDRVPVLTREQAEQYRNARVELEAFKQQFVLTGAAVGGAFLPALTGALETVEPLVAGFAEFAREYPHVLTGIAAIAAATVTLTGIIWAANAARAVAAALTPGVGWAALAAAAVIGGGVAAAGAAAVSRGRAALAEGAREQGQLTSGIEQAAEEGTRRGSMAAAEELMDFNQRTLDNILPRVECLENEREDPSPSPEPPPSVTLVGLSGAEEARIAVAEGRMDAVERWRQQQGQNVFTTRSEPADLQREAGLPVRSTGNVVDDAHLARVLEQRAALQGLRQPRYASTPEGELRLGVAPLDPQRVPIYLDPSSYRFPTAASPFGPSAPSSVVNEGDRISNIDARSFGPDAPSSVVNMEQDQRTIMGDDLRSPSQQTIFGDDFRDQRTIFGNDNRSFDQRSFGGDRGVTVYQTNNITTSQTAEDLQAEWEDAARYSGVGR